MKISNLFAFLVFIPFLVFGQNKQKPGGNTNQQKQMFELRGEVHEKVANIPLEFATIIVKQVKGDKVFGGMTNAKGKFAFEVPQGRYDISFEFISFKTVTKENVSVNKDLDFGEIFLEEDAETLDEAEEHSTITGVLGNFLPARFPFLVEPIQIGNDNGQQLQDDGGTDVRHNAQGKNREVAESPTGKHVKKAQESTLRLAEKCLQCLTVNSRCGHMSTDTIYRQQSKSRQDAAF